MMKLKQIILIYYILLLISSQQVNYNADLVQTTPFLQISFDSTNYHVCDLGEWDLDIICKTQGFQKDLVIYDSHTINYLTGGSCPSDEYGLELDCQSYYANNVNQCQSIEFSYCPDECVEIICLNYRCADQVPGSTDCNTCIGNGTGLYERAATTCECQNGKIDKYPEFENCQDDDPSDPSNGDLRIDQDVLQIFYNWSWKPVLHGSGFNEIAASIACKQQSFNSYKSFTNTQCPNEFYDDDEEEYLFWMQIISCQGNETQLQDCNRSIFGNAFGFEDQCIQLECINLPDGDGDIRLDGGVADKISVVEIQHYNFETSQLEWRPVCDVSLDRNMAHVICVDQGFKTYKNFWNSQECPNGEDTQFWLGRVICTGNENSLTSCRYPDGWEQTSQQCQCILIQCTDDWEFAKEGSIRISNNALEYFHNDQWGQVCTNKDKHNIANVVCKQIRQTSSNNLGLSMTYLKNLANSLGIEENDTQHVNTFCPNFSKFWISDIECATGKEATLSQCNINSTYGQHECGVNDCFHIHCEGDDIMEFFNYKDSDIRLYDDILQIYHDNVWKPISDSGNEYQPSEGYYGQGINKAAAHVICKQLGNATFSSIEKNQNCGQDFDGYWLGNIMCKGDEIKLSECFSLPWGETTSEEGNEDNCVKITCEKKRTCTGKNKQTLSSYPYCQCKDGYYDDGLSSDCQPCDPQCKTCIFSADQCVECAESQAIYEVWDYDRWFEINDERSNIRLLQDCSQYNTDCDSCDENSCLSCSGSYNPETNCTTVLTEQSCEDNGCCDYDQDCVECDNDTNQECLKCNPGYDINYDCYEALPGDNEDDDDDEEEYDEDYYDLNEYYGCGSCCEINYDCIKCDGNKCLECNPGWLLEYECDEEVGYNPCFIFSENCVECELDDNQLDGTCLSCGPNWDFESGCMTLLPEHDENALCVHINSNCIECKGDYCLKCVDGYLPEYNCELFQYNYCTEISPNCLECDILLDLCYECKPNYDLNYNCQQLQPITSVQAPCIKFSDKCYECTSFQCTKCTGTWDPTYNCIISIPISTICQASGCDNCNGYTCDTEPYTDPNSENPIAEFENKTPIIQSQLEYSQNIMVKIITPEGQMVDINAENINSLGIFSCTDNCAQGYFMTEDGSCDKCSGKCKVCEDSADNCLYCKYENNDYVGPTPYCSCQSGSKINGDNCSKCPAGYFSFELDSTECHECPNNAWCEGGNHMEVDQGFWRLNEESSIVVECEGSPDNCKGGSDPDTLIQCTEGHKGALCQACDLESEVWDKNYFHSSRYECEECDNNYFFLVILILIVNLYQIALLFITINGNISAVQDKTKFNSLKVLFNTHKPTPNDTAIIIKIISHFFFSLGIVVSLKISIPYALNMISISIQLPTIQLSYFMDCYMIEFQQSIPNIYFRIIGQIVYGIIQTLFVILLFKIFVFIKDNLCGSITKHYSGKTRITTYLYAQTVLIYQFLTLQPGIISLILEAVACRDIGGVNYIVSNTSKQCDTNEYAYYTWLLLMPLFIIIGFVITFTILHSIRKISKQKILNAADQQLQKIKEEKKQEKSEKKKKQNLKQIQPVTEFDYADNKQINLEKTQQTNRDQTQNQVDNSINFNDTTNNQILKSQDKSPAKLQEQTPNSNNVKDNHESSLSDRSNDSQQNEQTKNQNAGEEAENNNQKSFQKNKISKWQQLKKYFKKTINKGNQVIDRDEENLKLFPRDSGLDKSGPLTKYGYLYIEYKNIAYYWEFVKIIQRILMATILAFYYDDIRVKGIIVFLIIFFYTSLSYNVKPYNIDSHNRLDILASVISGITLILGVFIYENEYDEWVYASYIIIICMNVYFIIYVIKQFLNKYVENFLNGLTFFLEKKIQITIMVQKIQEFVELTKQGQLSEENQKRVEEIINYFSQLPQIPPKVIKEIEKILKYTIPTELINQGSQSNLEKNEQKQVYKEKQSFKENKDDLFFKNDYEEYKAQLEVEEKKFKNYIFKSQVITLILVGSTSSPVTISKAKYLKKMMKSYFKNILVEGYNYGIVQPSYQYKESKALNTTYHQLQKPTQSYPIIDVIEGKITEDQQKSIFAEVNMFKEEQLRINQQIVQKLALNYAQRLKNLNYPQSFWEGQLNGSQEKNDTFIKQGTGQIISQNEDQNVEEQIKELTNRLTDLDIQQEYESFKLFDLKEEYKISIGQINKNLKRLDQDISINEIEYMLSYADQEGKGYIDFAQFLALISIKKGSGQDLEPIKELYSYYNSQQNGEMTYLDISLILEQIFNIKETLQVIKELINILDDNKTKSINFEEFLKLVL